MLVILNSIDTIKNNVKVTQLDIDDYGSIILSKDLELNVIIDKQDLTDCLNMPFSSSHYKTGLKECD
jgi:hypothetical protein